VSFSNVLIMSKNVRPRQS